MRSSNTYLPYQMRIDAIVDEAPGVRTFTLKFMNRAEAEEF